MIEQLKSDKLKLTADLKKVTWSCNKGNRIAGSGRRGSYSSKTNSTSRWDGQANITARSTKLDRCHQILERYNGKVCQWVPPAQAWPELLYRSIKISVGGFHRDNARQLFSAWKTGQEDDTKILSAWNKFLYWNEKRGVDLSSIKALWQTSRPSSSHLLLGGGLADGSFAAHITRVRKIGMKSGL